MVNVSLFLLLWVFHVTDALSAHRRLSMSSEASPVISAAVFGATGRTGRRIVERLAAQGVRVIACCRPASAEKAKDLFDTIPSVMIKPTTLETDSESSTIASMEESMKGCSTVVCALGALETEALNWRAPFNVDGKLTQLVIEAAANSKSVEHLIMVSSLGTDAIGFPASILNLFWGVLTWKRQSELKLIQSGLRYTIVRPGGMERPTDDYERTHNTKLFPASSQFGGLISRKQIAQLCAAAVQNPDTSTNLVVEAIADPSFPKRTPEDLLASMQQESDKQRRQQQIAQFQEEKTEDSWRKQLTYDQFYVLRQAGTEAPFASPLNNEKRAGVFKCAGCGNELFSSAYKFNSGTGWPSFTSPLKPNGESVSEREDYSLGGFIKRTEVVCSKCGGHLGHVFPDGPRPTGLRYCMNGVAMTFSGYDELTTEDSTTPAAAGVDSK